MSAPANTPGQGRRQAPQAGGRRAQRSDGQQVAPLVRAGHMVALFLVLTPIVLALSGVAMILLILLFSALAG